LTQLLTPLPYPLKGLIYRSPLPFSWLFDPDACLFDAYQEARVEMVVMLTPVAETVDLTGRDMRAFFESHGLDVIYVPVEDFSVPEDGMFQKAIPAALTAAKSGRTMVIHCHAGIGRTGMFAACLAKVVFDISGKEAVRWVRQFIPDAVENLRQIQFVQEFDLTGDE
jgi:protein-tyrosine phosphatase